MVQMTDEALTGLRLLICMAKADGVLEAEERHAIEDSLIGQALPQNLTLDKLLAEQNNPRELAAKIQSHTAQKSIYASLSAMAFSDRKVSPEEEGLLSFLRDIWRITREEEHALIASIEANISRVPVTKSVPSIRKSDEECAHACHRLTLRYSIMTGITGAIPVPIVPDLMVIPMQVKMVYDIARVFGQTTDRATVQLMFETLGVGTGARLGISALTKLVPGWGSVVGAASSFVTTYALAKVAEAYFRSEGKTPIESLKPLYREARQSGRLEFEKHKAAMDAAHRQHSITLKELAVDLQQGKITQKQYEERLESLDASKARGQ